MKKKHILLVSEVDYTNLKNLSYNEIDLTIWENIHFHNFEDYDVFFLNFEGNVDLKNVNINYLNPLLNWDLEQLIFIFPSKIESVSKKNRIEFTNFNVNLIWSELPSPLETKGQNIILRNTQDKILPLILDNSFSYTWNWSIKREDLPDNAYILAENKIGNIISLLMKRKKKNLIFIPHPDNLKEYIEMCIQNIDEITEELTKFSKHFILKKPNWLGDYDIFQKASKLKQINQLKKEVKQLERFEILLYGYGKPLEKSIAEIFSFLGFKEIKRSSTSADLICEIQSFKFIAEITGITHQAYENDVSQMFKWIAEEKVKETKSKKKVKQLFICNAFRDIIPTTRESYFHERVIELSKVHHWGLLSTLELYHALLKIRKKELKKEDIIAAIENQEGIIEF